MRVDVEAEMAHAVKAAGGEVLDETLPKSRNFKNADYVFRSGNVVAELKRFEHAGIHDEKFIARVSALYAKHRAVWQQQGRRDVPIAFGRRVKIQVNEFPREFQIEFLGLVKDLVQNHLRRANLQIKSTKEALGMPEALGLLLFCVDSSSGLTLEILLNVFDHSLRGDYFTSINGLAFFSANYAIALPGQPAIRPFLFAGKEDRPGVTPELVTRIGRALGCRFAAQSGPLLVIVGPGSPPELLREKFRPI